MIIRRQTLIAALAATTPEDTRYFLHSIRFEPEHNRAVATDGHILLIVTDRHDMTDADFPNVPGATFSEEPTAPFCMPADMAKSMIAALPKKSTIPILTAIRAGRNGDPNAVTVAATDLESSKIATIRDVGENAQRFPAYDRVIPKEDRAELAVNLAIPVLEHLIKAAKAIEAQTIRFALPTGAADRAKITIPAVEAQAATDTTPAVEAQEARTEKGDVTSQVRITMTSNDGFTINGVAMPCRL